MKRYAALLTALLMIVSVLPASAEATPADYLGKWYAATGIAYDGTPAYLGSLEISLELSRDKTAVLSYAGIEIHTSWRYLGGGAVLASAGDTQYDMSIEGGRLRIESLPVESGEFGKEKTEVNFSYDDSVPKTYVVFEREPAGDMPELPLKRPAAVEDELYGVYDVMYAVQDGVVFDFIARNLRIKIAYCMADFAGATVMTDFRDGAVIIDDPRLVGSSSGDAIMYIFPTADENMIVIETGGITIYCTKVGESTAKTADAAVAMPSVETMETAARSYLDELGDTYTAEEYLRAVAGGAEPQPEREFEVIKEGPTDTRKIAITVDDLNEVDNLKTILNVANQYNAKITLFAIGDNVDRNSDLRVTLKEAYMMGHEIENHTYDHAKLYSLNDSNMAYQIFATQKAVNNALGYEYQMHFIRMPGGNGEHDLRSHQYLYQLNDLGLADYKAIVNWTFSGSNGIIEDIKSSLKGGHIYLFHCKADDTKKLEEFIPYAVSQGYELVTLNEMLGYPENSISPLKDDALAYEIPEPYPYVYTNLVLLDGKPHSHRGQMYVVQLLQRRLIELGYLSKNAVVDGDFGNDTTIAVKLFQYYNDLDMDGQAGSFMQKLLFSSNAKPNTSPYVAGEPDTYPEDGKIGLSANTSSYVAGEPETYPTNQNSTSAPTPTPIPRTLYADRITKKDVTGAKWLTDKDTRIDNGITVFEVLPGENGGDVICITGWSFGTYYNAGKGWDGKYNTTYLTVTNSKGDMAFYPVKNEPGITGVTHEIKGGKNMDRADFTCVIDVSNWPDGTYSLGTCNYFTITQNGTTYKFHHGYTLGESYEIVVNSGKVTAVGGVENN